MWTAIFSKRPTDYYKTRLDYWKKKNKQENLEKWF